MSITGEAHDPPTKLGLPMGDLAGGLWGSIAVLAALHRRERDPAPQHIDLSLLEGLGGLLGYLGQLALLTGQSPMRLGSSHHSVVPYGRFEAKDGHLVVALHVGSFWRKFCRAIDRPELAEDERFRSSAGRVAHRDVLVPLLEDVLRTRTRAEWQQVLATADIPHAPVLDVREALEHPQVQERGVLRDLHHPDAGEVQVYGPVIRFVGEEPEALRPAPRLGEHTREICRTVLGLADAEIDALVAAGVVEEP
jgi:crotonobetainyl-CoA:carnitine CoA-transferase CaiB-like acyl-CoA transferase